MLSCGANGAAAAPSAGMGYCITELLSQRCRPWHGSCKAGFEGTFCSTLMMMRSALRICSFSAAPRSFGGMTVGAAACSASAPPPAAGRPCTSVVPQQPGRTPQPLELETCRAG